MRRVRPVLVVALGVTVLGSGLALVLPGVLARSDAAELEQARSLARELPAPQDAVASTECHGDGQVGCWRSTSSVPEVAQALAASLDELTDEQVDLSCEALDSPDGAYPPDAQSCFVRVRMGDHGTFVFVDPVIDRADDSPALAGSVVALSAS